MESPAADIPSFLNPAETTSVSINGEMNSWLQKALRHLNETLSFDDYLQRLLLDTELAAQTNSYVYFQVSLSDNVIYPKYSNESFDGAYSFPIDSNHCLGKCVETKMEMSLTSVDFSIYEKAIPQNTASGYLTPILVQGKCFGVILFGSRNDSTQMNAVELQKISQALGFLIENRLLLAKLSKAAQESTFTVNKKVA